LHQNRRRAKTNRGRHDDREQRDPHNRSSIASSTGFHIASPKVPDNEARATWFRLVLLRQLRVGEVQRAYLNITYRGAPENESNWTPRSWHT
jgi:hypothetical protein